MAKHRSALSTRRVGETLNYGLEHHRAGRLDQASICYAAILRLQPAHADALHLSGVIARERGDLATSEHLLTQAIQSRSSVSSFHFNLGYTRELLGKQSEARLSYRSAIALDPQNLAAVQRYAFATSEEMDPTEAITLYEALLNLTPDSAEAHYDLGRLYQRKADLTKAAICYRRAIELESSCFEFHFNLATVLFQTGLLADAAESYRKAILIKPEETAAYYSLGVVLQTLGEVIQAAQAYVSAIKIRPDFPEALSNLGSLCVDMDDPLTAEGLLRRSIALNPKNVDAHCNLASALIKRGNTADALESFRNALTLDPTHALTLCNLGTHFETSGDRDSAIRCYQLALTSHPDSQLAQFSLSLQHLMAGNFAVGWQGYEARWGTPQFRNLRPSRLQQQWRGEDIGGSRILLYSEQGLGDTLQFVRYAPMVAALGANVVLRVQPSLVRLFSLIDPAITVVSTESDHGADVEWQCPLLSLPLAFRTDLTSIPRLVPYLQADPSETDAWAQYIPAHGLRVGLVWAGNPTHTRDKQRSIPLQYFAKVTQLQNVTCYSLQMGTATKELITSPLRIVDLSHNIKDFSHTAAILDNLDLVICVDTAVAHLAGAMGKPVWLLLPYVGDWRWLRDRSDSPWYPTMRLFRQSAIGRWDEVVEQLELDLRAMSVAMPSLALSRLAEGTVAINT